MSEDVFDVAIAGAGFSGLGMAIALKREGVRSFVVLEKAGAVGGTWRENRYPGCACDIPSNLYSFSFAPNPDWTRLYPPQAEIQAYLERCTDRFGVRDSIRFNTTIKSAAWDETQQLWRIDTNNGVVHARALVSGMGGLHVPNMPDMPGMAAFKGQSWHSADWRDDVSLAGKRVAIIGSGASAVQIVPEIAPIVAQLDLYQRTPSWVMPKNDRAVDESERARYRTAPLLQDLKRRLVYLVHEARVPLFMHPAKEGDGFGAKLAHKHVANQISDPALREKVTPKYRLGCKRVLISDDYYPALTRANVELVAEGASAIAENGVIDAHGKLRDADVIIYATGFKPMDLITNVEITGIGGRKLNDEWAGGPQAYLGTVVSGFPNFFTLMGPNSGLGHNSMIYMIESQIHFVMQALDTLDAMHASALDVRADVQQAFNAEIQAKLEASVWGTGCTSWYLSPDGKNCTLWPDYTFRFRARTKQVREEDFVFATK
ncbi:MAG: NAD(P)/FAD-dependent oxidoreductase [Pseudomonadota bacterium]